LAETSPAIAGINPVRDAEASKKVVGG